MPEAPLSLNFEMAMQMIPMRMEERKKKKLFIVSPTKKTPQIQSIAEVKNIAPQLQPKDTS